MGAKCEKCGMVSDRDDICTWCNADIRRTRPPDKGPAGSRTAPPPGPGTRTEPPTAPAARTGPPPGTGQPAAPTRQRVREVPQAARSGAPSWLIPVLVAGGAVLVIVVGLYAYGLSQMKPVPEPGEWASLTAVGNALTLSYPKGWGEPENAGAEGTSAQVTLRPNKLARVQVLGTGTRGARGDTAAAAERLAGGNLPIAQSADGAVLAMDAEQFAKARSGYQAGDIQETYNCASRKSATIEYTYTKRVGLLPVKMKGMRWGWFGGDLGFVCYAEAPEKHWEQFWATAAQVVGSIKQG